MLAGGGRRPPAAGCGNGSALCAGLDMVTGYTAHQSFLSSTTHGTQLLCSGEILTVSQSCRFTDRRRFFNLYIDEV